ncbi:MAG TPA: cation:proton antiporter [Candidatus Binatia bacterium]|jgi:multicomponent Na+:H+ antiporter subunit F|nr:cation:proton antiporter [Candidatus Binatia bacterium]
MNPAGLLPELSVTNLVFGVIVLAMLLAFIRLVRGPSLPDRVVALDLITIQIAAMLAVDTIATGQAVFLDAAIVLALISFLGTVAFARYLERRGHDE